MTLSELWLGKHEVTNAQYRRWHPDHDQDNEGEAELPVTRVTWHDAKAFCDHFGFELPTEAQWEYAARAGSGAAYSFGDDASVLGRYGWYGENSGDQAHPVGTREANAWGVHDMHGNVWEWVADVYGPYSAEPQTDPTGPPETPGASRVLRGGAFADEPGLLRSACRIWAAPVASFPAFGFRCVRLQP